MLCFGSNHPLKSEEFTMYIYMVAKTAANFQEK